MYNYQLQTQSQNLMTLITRLLKTRWRQEKILVTSFFSFSHHVFKCTLPQIEINISITFSKRQISDSSKLKKFADDNFKFDEKGRKFSDRVENIVGKTEKLFVNKQFLLFSQCFKQKKTGLFGRGLS